MSEKHDEQQIRQLQKLFRRHGITVRRENLSRGPSFRVKSGGCVLTGERIIFLDRRLPPDQQLNTLVDHLVAADLPLSADDVAALPQGVRSYLERSAGAVPAM
jgi:hypothetical protein